MAIKKVSIFEYLKKYELTMPLWIYRPELEQDSPQWTSSMRQRLMVRKLRQFLDRRTDHDKLLYYKLFPLPTGWDDWMPKEEALCMDAQRLCRGRLCLTPWQPQIRCRMPLPQQGIRRVNKEDILGPNYWEAFCVRVYKDDLATMEFYSILHFMLCCHALFRNDLETVEKLRYAMVEDPCWEREKKRMIRAASSDWKEILPHVLGLGLYRSFCQNNFLREALLETGDAPILYVDPDDPVLGGSFADGVYKGQNLYGLALMEVRSELRRVYDNLVFCLGDPNKKKEEKEEEDDSFDFPF